MIFIRSKLAAVKTAELRQLSLFLIGSGEIGACRHARYFRQLLPVDKIIPRIQLIQVLKTRFIVPKCRIKSRMVHKLITAVIVGGVPVGITNLLAVIVIIIIVIIVVIVTDHKLTADGQTRDDGNFLGQIFLHDCIHFFLHVFIELIQILQNVLVLFGDQRNGGIVIVDHAFPVAGTRGVTSRLINEPIPNSQRLLKNFRITFDEAIHNDLCLNIRQVVEHSFRLQPAWIFINLTVTIGVVVGANSIAGRSVTVNPQLNFRRAVFIAKTVFVIIPFGMVSAAFITSGMLILTVKKLIDKHLLQVLRSLFIFVKSGAKIIIGPVTHRRPRVLFIPPIPTR